MSTFTLSQQWKPAPEPDFGVYVPPANIGHYNQIEKDKSDFYQYQSDLTCAAMAIEEGWRKCYEFKEGGLFWAHWTSSGGRNHPNARVIAKLEKLGYRVTVHVHQQLVPTVAYTCVLANSLR